MAIIVDVSTISFEDLCATVVLTKRFNSCYTKGECQAIKFIPFDFTYSINILDLVKS